MVASVAPSLSPAEDAALTAMIAESLPPNYNFEVRKTLARAAAVSARRLALQFPEGLLRWSCALADIISRFSGAEVVILGDVTYGACCVDDLAARALGCDLLVHYGHSCLVPVQPAASGGLATLYVFVDVAFDVRHLVAVLVANFAPGARLALAGTIQFAGALAGVRTALASAAPGLAEGLLVPQARPLSAGEVLGCTSPRLAPGSADALVFVADGRFHLEALMIHNPELPAFRYDPYARRMTRETYATEDMRSARAAAIAAAAPAASWGLILGTLGRQGSPAILDRLRARFDAASRTHFVLLLSEVTPAKLRAFGGSVQAWVQVACPRLSIDWGDAFPQPCLTPYEAEVALGTAAWRDVYPMSYYARGGESWTNYYKAPPSETLAAPSTKGL